MDHSFKLNLQSSLLVLSFGATPVWALDFVNAQAFQNLDPVTVTDNNTGLTASAQKEYNAAGQRGSAASTSRTSTQVGAYGYGTSTTTHYDAISSTRSEFTLWDLASNSALPSAAGLGLTFNFTLSGYFDVGPTSLSSANFTYEVGCATASTPSRSSAWPLPTLQHGHPAMCAAASGGARRVPTRVR
jgi:hypothetical protein